MTILSNSDSPRFSFDPVPEEKQSLANYFQVSPAEGYSPTAEEQELAAKLNKQADGMGINLPANEHLASLVLGAQATYLKELNSIAKKLKSGTLLHSTLFVRFG